MRKQRENTILRGIRGSACRYLNRQILDCIIYTRELIESKQLLAIVTMTPTSIRQWDDGQTLKGSDCFVTELMSGLTLGLV